jgi:hypothetical protein
MIIAEFKRDADNNIIAVDAEGKETQLNFAYVAEHRPQVGDEYFAEPAEPAADAA